MKPVPPFIDPSIDSSIRDLVRKRSYSPFRLLVELPQEGLSQPEILDGEELGLGVLDLPLVEEAAPAGGRKAAHWLEKQEFVKASAVLALVPMLLMVTNVVKINLPCYL